MPDRAVADLILYNASVITLDVPPRAEMVAIQGDTIVATGPNEDRNTFSGPATRLIDCQGKTVVPGFIDAHCHILGYLRSLLSLDVSPAAVSSIAEIKAALHIRAAQLPPGTWIHGTGFNEFYLAEKRYPTRRDLDEACPLHPVQLVHRSSHVQVLNSPALALIGITTETEEPPGGIMERDLETGEPNGILLDMAGFVGQRLPDPGPGELEAALPEASQSYLSQGLTSLQDASASNDLRRWHLFDKLRDRLPSRVWLMMGSQHWQDFLAQGLAPGYGDSRLRLGAVKFILNETTGSLHPPQDELNEMVLAVHRAGFPVAIHALDTVEAAATALEYALEQHPRPHRHRIEHCSVCPPATLKRLANLGVVVVTQPVFLFHSGERYLSEVPTHQLPWLYRIRSFLESGLRPAAGSDSPVAPINPLLGIYAAVTRRASTGQEILPHEAIAPLQALRMYASAAAYASGEEAEKGTITPGKLADLVVLSHDPTHIPPDEIKDIKVEMTIVGGQIAWGGV